MMETKFNIAVIRIIEAVLKVRRGNFNCGVITIAGSSAQMKKRL